MFGGAEVDVYMIATELAKDTDFEVCCIVADYGQEPDELREDVRLLKSLTFNENKLTGVRKIWMALKQADAAVYLLKTASPGVPLVRRFCANYGRGFVYRTAHRDECDGTYVNKHPVWGRLFIRSLKQADIVFAQNQSDAALLKTRYGIEAVTIPNGHRIRSITGRPRQWILWVGRSAEFKHPERFLQLAEQFPGESFLMICQKATGDTNYDRLQSQAGHLENVQFLERVDFDEIDAAFEKARVFVNTSDSEGFANTFIQACKAGTAILSYTVNPDGFLDTHQCGVACGGDAQRLAEQLRMLLDNERYIDVGARGRQYAEDTHDIARIIEQYKQHFRRWENP